jgi:hypothetical protein
MSAEEIRKETAAQKEKNESFREYQAILGSIAGELGKQKSEVQQAKKEYNSLISISKQLATQEEGITRLSDKKLNTLQETAAENVRMLGIQAEQLALKGAETEEEKSLLAAASQNFQLEKDLLGGINANVSARKESNRALGVAGNALKGLEAISPGFAKALKIDKINEEMQKFADKAAEGGGKVSRLATLGVGMKSAFSNLGETLTDPSVILGSLIKGFKEVDKAAVDFQRTTGEAGNSISVGVDSMNFGFVTMVDYLKAANALSKDLGMNARKIFGPEDIQEASIIEHKMGMTADQANQLAKFSAGNNKSLKANNEALVAGVNSYNAQNKGGILAKGVLEDIASVSVDIGILYTGFPEKLGAAGAAAAAMGTNLAGVKKLAEGLLDFENSIAKEMEAELLTGKQLNLEKARQFALSGDLEGVSKELMNQGITQASFGKMNLFAQKAQAEALGMSTEEMAKMLMQQGLSLDMSEEGLSAAQKQTLEGMKAQEASKSMEDAMAKISQALAPIVGIFASVVTFIAKIVSYKPVLIALMAAFALSKMKAVSAAFGGIKDSLGGAVDNMKSLKEGLGSVISGGGTDKLKESLGFGEKIAGKTDELPELPESPEAGIGEKIKDFLTGLSDGLKKMGRKGVIKGALALIPAAIGLIALGIATPALAILAMIPGPALQASLTGLGAGLSALGTSLMGPQLLGLALGLGILTVSMIGIGYALKLAAPGIEAFGVVITSIFAGVGTVITAVADGFVKLMGAISMENIGPLLLLGPALLGISAGLASMAVTGIMALPAIAGLVALSLVAAPLIRLAELGVIGDGGGRGDEGNNKDSMIADKLDQLIAVVERGGDIFLDGAKVGRNLAIASSKIG